MQTAASAVLHWQQHRKQRVSNTVTIPIPRAPHANIQGMRHMKLKEFLWKDPGHRADGSHCCILLASDMFCLFPLTCYQHYKLQCLCQYMYLSSKWYLY